MLRAVNKRSKLDPDKDDQVAEMNQGAKDPDRHPTPYSLGKGGHREPQTSPSAQVPHLQSSLGCQSVRFQMSSVRNFSS